VLLFIHTNLKNIIQAETNETMLVDPSLRPRLWIQVLRISYHVLHQKIKKDLGVERNEEREGVPLFFSLYEMDKNLNI